MASRPISSIDRQGRSSRGVVLVTTLLALILLVGLIAFVLNMGSQVNRRARLQNAADATAAAGAGWVARSMNTVAANNVAQARYLGMINTLDAMPTATAAALQEQTFLRDALRSGSSVNTRNGELDRVVKQQVDNLLTELDQEIELLQPIHDHFQSNDVARMTHYNGPHGRGDIWRAMEALDQYSQATMENLSQLAQINAVRGGEVNLPGDLDSSAFIVPVITDVPWQRSRFYDFDRPVTLGLLPEKVDEKQTNRGPFDTIFGWRDRLHRYPYSYQPIPSGGFVGGVRSTAPSIFGGGPSGFRYPGGPPEEGELSAYSVYGTHEWSKRKIHRVAYRSRKGQSPKPANLEESRFWPWFSQLADTKRDYVWRNLSPREFATPDWHSQYPSVPEDAAEPLDFSETGYFRLDIRSRFARNEAGFMSPGSWWFENVSRADYDAKESVLVIEPLRQSYPRPYQSAWWLPTYRMVVDGVQQTLRMKQPEELSEHYPQITVEKAGSRAWVYEYEYEVMSDPEIGLFPKAGPQKAHFIQVIIFAGVNRNPIRPTVFDPAEEARIASSDPERDVRRVQIAINLDTLTPSVENPYDGLDPNAIDSPAPTDIVHQKIAALDKDSHRRYLTYLAIARQSDQASAWPSQFDGNKPYPNAVAIAQVRVFNNHSWDLWTQMWHAQLEPVQDYAAWIDTMKTVSDDVEETAWIRQDEYDNLQQYLSSLKALADVTLSH